MAKLKKSSAVVFSVFVNALSSCSHFCYWDGFRLEHTMTSLDIFWPPCLAWLVPFSGSPLTFSAGLGRKKSWLEIETLVMMQTKPKRNDKPQLPVIHSEQNSEDGLYFKMFYLWLLAHPQQQQGNLNMSHWQVARSSSDVRDEGWTPFRPAPEAGHSVFPGASSPFIISASPAPVCSGILGSSMCSA